MVVELATVEVHISDVELGTAPGSIVLSAAVPASTSVPDEQAIGVVFGVLKIKPPEAVTVEPSVHSGLATKSSADAEDMSDNVGLTVSARSIFSAISASNGPNSLVEESSESAVIIGCIGVLAGFLETLADELGKNC